MISILLLLGRLHFTPTNLGELLNRLFALRQRLSGLLEGCFAQSSPAEPSRPSSA